MSLRVPSMSLRRSRFGIGSTFPPRPFPATSPVMEIEPVGVVHSCFGDKFAVPRQPGLCPSAWGELVFHPPFRSPEAVRGLDGFSHVWLLFHFHLVGDDSWHPTVRPPRLGGNQRVGVFASRSPFRPNPLGLSLARLEGIDSTRADGPVLLLGGIDLSDGTPVFDVKPYLPWCEAPPAATSGFATGEPALLEVMIEDSARSEFGQLPARAQSLIREALAQDPRPAIHGDDPQRPYGALLCQRNVRFRIAHDQCRVFAIDPTPEPRT